MQTDNKMGTASINKLILTMSLPPLFSMFLQYSYNLIDSAFVAHLSENALTAVSLSFPLTTIMNATSIWVGVGINVLIAGYLGRKKQTKANSIASTGLLLSFILGLILNLIVLAASRTYFQAFTSNDEIFSLCIEYMRICAFIQIPNMVHIAIQKMLQATGNMIAPMWFQIAGVIVNIMFDPLLIFGIGPFPKLGISGAAIATVMGYAFSMVLALFLLFNGKQAVQIEARMIRFDFLIIKNIFVCGFPSFIMNALSAFTVTFANLFLVAYSDTAIAFFGAYYKIKQLVEMTVNGLIQGCLPIMRVNYGAGKQARVKSAFHYGTAYASIMMLLGTLVLAIMPTQLLSLFAASESMQEFGKSAMRIMSVGYLFCGFTIMIATYFQAIDRVIESNILQLMRQFIVLLPAMWVLNHTMQISGIWISFPITELISFGAAIILLMICNRKSKNKQSSLPCDDD